MAVWQNHTHETESQSQSGELVSLPKTSILPKPPILTFLQLRLNLNLSIFKLFFQSKVYHNACIILQHHVELVRLPKTPILPKPPIFADWHMYTQPCRVG